MVGWSRLSQLDLTRLCKNTLAPMSQERGNVTRLARHAQIVPSEMTQLTLHFPESKVGRSDGSMMSRTRAYIRLKEYLAADP